MKSTKTLRELINGTRPALTAPVWDCLSSLIVERAGFDFVSQSGFCVSAAQLGMLDIGLPTLTETVTQTRNIANCVRIPILTDAEQGYGTAIHMIRTIKELEQAGAQGVLIDDKVVETCPWLPDKSLANRYFRGVISEEEMVGKVKAAVHARETDDFVILFRTNIRGTAVAGPLEPALQRVRKAVDAGADIVNVSLKDPHEIQIWDDLGFPLHATLTGGWAEGKTFAQISNETKNIKMINIGPTDTIRQVSKALLDLLLRVRKEDSYAPLRRDNMPMDEWMDLLSVDVLSEQIREFIPEK